MTKVLLMMDITPISGYITYENYLSDELFHHLYSKIEHAYRHGSFELENLNISVFYHQDTQILAWTHYKTNQQVYSTKLTNSQVEYLRLRNV